MWLLFRNLFDDSALSPHGICLLWRPELVGLHVVSDGVIAFSYFSIPFALGAIAYKRPDVQYSWVFWCFAAFITACGLTHVMAIVTLWKPLYGVEGVVKAITAAVSIATAVALWPLLPRVLAYPTPAQYRGLGARLVGAERQLRLLVDGVSDHAIFMLDPKGVVTSWNVGAERIFGYDASEIVGRPFSAFFSQEDRRGGAPEEELKQAALHGKHRFELKHFRKDGRPFLASVTLNAVRDEHGVLVGFAKITQDVTELREAEEKLRISREQLAQAQKMEAVGQLTGGVAHDFNNLLTIVLGNIELTQRALRDASAELRAKLEKPLTNAAAGARRAASLTQRLLAFARRQPLAPRLIDTSALLSSIEELLHGSLPETIETQFIVPNGLWRVEVDPSQLESAIVNLALNSRDAMPKGGRLWVEAENLTLDKEFSERHADFAPGQYVRISVNDTGLGMSPEALNRAFEPFYTTKPPGQGTGLGLSLVYGFVKQSGGNVTIYSEPGKGSSVKIYLPRAKAGAAAPTLSEPEGTPSDRPATEAVLVVEDEEQVRDYVVATLSDLGYRVTARDSAENALKYLEAETAKLDLLLTDVVLPGMDGVDFAQKAARLRPGLKVVYMSGYPRSIVSRQGWVGPGMRLLQKPLTRSDLAKGLRSALDS